MFPGYEFPGFQETESSLQQTASSGSESPLSLSAETPGSRVEARDLFN
jgi:hypothetical protein